MAHRRCPAARDGGADACRHPLSCQRRRARPRAARPCPGHHVFHGDWQVRSRDLKWRLHPAIIVSLALLILTGALGAAADPASAVGFRGIGPFTGAQVHLSIAIATLLVNAAVNVWEYRALSRNGQLVNEVLGEVRRIRAERGLEV